MPKSASAPAVDGRSAPDPGDPPPPAAPPEPPRRPESRRGRVVPLDRKRGEKASVARLQERLKDDMRFLRTWAEHPLSTAAVTPSGGMLSRLMARFVEADRDGPVVELGPGTGAVTRALLERGIEEDRLLLVEWNPEFCELLAERYPAATVVNGDAFDLAATLGDLPDHSVASIISGLPLFVKPVPAREKLLDDALRVMAPGAPFIQFSYALVPAVPNKPRRYAIERSSWVLANLPPARVWTYRAIV